MCIGRVGMVELGQIDAGDAQHKNAYQGHTIQKVGERVSVGRDMIGEYI